MSNLDNPLKGDAAPQSSAATAEPDEYIGYGHPPSKSRFQKGHPYYPPKSGKSRQRHLSRAIERALEVPIRVEIDNEITYRPLADVLVNRLIERALEDEKSLKPFQLLIALIERHEAEAASNEITAVTPEQSRRVLDNFISRLAEANGGGESSDV